MKCIRSIKLVLANLCMLCRFRDTGNGCGKEFKKCLENPIRMFNLL